MAEISDVPFIGAVLRVYAPSEDKIIGLGRQVENTLDAFYAAGIRKVAVVVWCPTDPIFKGDYGGGYQYLGTLLNGMEWVTVLKNTGDNFMMGPTLGCMALYAHGCTHALIASQGIEIDVGGFVTEADEAIAQGAHVVASCVEGTEELVPEGFVNNAWCLWNIQTLIAVGGFDERDTGPAHIGDQYGEAISGCKPYAGVAECLVLEPMYHLLQQPFVYVSSLTVHYPGTLGQTERQAKKNASKRSRVDQLLEDTEISREQFKTYVIQ